jgi:uncharacterized membrane protein YqjE
MGTGSPRILGLLDLWAAHRELTALEWSEFQQTIVAASAWLVCAALCGFAGWLGLNAAVIITFREQPLQAVLSVAVANLVVAALAAWRASRLFRRPFFSLTKREAVRDADTILKVIS